MAKGSPLGKRKMIGHSKMKRRGAPFKAPEDRLDVTKTIKFNHELEQKLRAMARDEKGSKAVNSLVRRVCEQAAEDWMKEKGYTSDDIIKLISR